MLWASGLSTRRIARHRSDRRSVGAPTVLGCCTARASPRLEALPRDAGSARRRARRRAVCARSAAAWWGLPGYDLRALHVTRPRGITSSPTDLRADSTRSRRSEPQDVTVLDGVPDRPARADDPSSCARSVHPQRAERALDAAWSRGLLSGRSCRAFLEALAASGRNGIVARCDSCSKHRPDDYVPPASNLEGRVKDILAGAGLGEWRRQVDTGGETMDRPSRLPSRNPAGDRRGPERALSHSALTDTADDRTAPEAARGRWLRRGRGVGHRRLAPPPDRSSIGRSVRPSADARTSSRT